MAKKKKQIVRPVNHDEAKQLLENGAVLIDVREKMELMSKRVPSAIHHPMSNIPPAIDTKDATAAIFFCASGARTNSYATQLAQRVNVDTYVLTGGMYALSRMGVPTEGGGGFFKVGLAAGALLLAGWAGGFIPGL